MTKDEESRIIKWFKDKGVPFPWIESEDIESLIDKGFLDRKLLDSDYNYPVGTLSRSFREQKWYLTLLGLPVCGEKNFIETHFLLNTFHSFNLNLQGMFPDGPINGSWSASAYKKENEE